MDKEERSAERLAEIEGLQKQHAELGEQRVKAHARIREAKLELQKAEADLRSVIAQRLALQAEMERDAPRPVLVKRVRTAR